MPVINIRRSTCDVYVGRVRGSDTHFGNPFTFKADTLASVVLESRAACIQAYRDWLEGTAHQQVEPTRRQWILDNLHTLRGKRLGCYCAPQACHGDVLEEMANLQEA